MIVDNMTHIINMNAACRDIGRYQNIYRAILEAFDDRLSLALFHVTVEPLGIVTDGGEDSGKPVDLTFCAAEDDGFFQFFCIEQTDNGIVTLILFDDIVVLRNVFVGGLIFCDCNKCRLDKDAFRQFF